MVGWSCLWIVSFGSTVYITSGCNAQGECQNEPNNILVFAMLLSYYWTAQVIKNVCHVTVAGTVGTWWFTPIEARSFCSHGVRDSFVRSVTTSFGSICLGSILVAIVGFILGVVLTSTLMTLVSSAVNTVIVCHAEAPQEFETNHPKLSGEMRAAWKQAWPRDFSY